VSATVDQLQAVADEWRPEELEVAGDISARRAVSLARLLRADEPVEGQRLPLMWHEAFVREDVRYDELGDDGHPLRTGLLPPLPQRRRIFGGSEVLVYGGLVVGEQVRRQVRITDVRVRVGQAGPLLLLTEHHRWIASGELRLEERRDIVYRTAASTAPGKVDSPPRPTPPTTPSTPTESRSSRSDDFRTDPRMLFLFSALTSNAHRIHYDRPYATEVEGYRDLLVHGPLTGLLAAEGVRRAHGDRVETYHYRLQAPAHVGERLSFAIVGRSRGLVEVTGFAEGRVVLTARVTLAG